jgi:hypothetical protein
MSEIHAFAPVTAEEISVAIEQDTAARDVEHQIKEAGRKAAAAVPRRLFRAAARDSELRAAAYRSGVDAATHNKG